MLQILSSLRRLIPGNKRSPILHVGRRRVHNPCDSLTVELLEDRWLPSTIQLIQNLGVGSNVTAGTTSLSIPVPASGVHAGDSIIVSVAINLPLSGLNGSVSVTDAAGNSYHQDASESLLGVTVAGQLLIFSAQGGMPLSSGQNITINFPNTAESEVADAAEFAGLTGLNALDQTSVNSGALSTTPSSGQTPMTTQANELVLGGLAAQAVSGLGSLTMSGGFTTLATPSIQDLIMASGYEIVSSVGQYAATGTLSLPASAFEAAVVTYRADAATHFSLIPGAGPLTAGSSFSVTVDALDASNNVDPGYTGTVHFSSSDQAAGLPTDYTFTAADHGVHTFTFTLHRAGSQTIGVADARDGSMTGSAATLINPGAANHLLVSMPSNTIAGEPSIVTVTALDPDNNVATSYTGTVHFSSSDLSALLPADYTFSLSDQGTHDFTVTLNTQGNQQVDVTDTANDSIGGSAGTSVGAGGNGETSGPVPWLTQVYFDLLARPIDAPGQAYWNNLLSNGISHMQVVLDIESSIEYRTDEVQHLYSKYLHRTADPSGLNAFVSYLQNGGTVEQVAALIAGSSEYFQNQSGGSNAGFLATLYQDALNRSLDSSGQTAFENALAQGATRTQVAGAILGSQEYDQDLVQGFYTQYLKRTADPTGLNAFVAGLQQHAPDELIIADLLASAEYIGKTTGP
ncbi:MAG TPA: DUF4214 domain-containing protein [Gemmataceae bacterium]|nr:DUF4214 domain-containing protein [Gemmataceae bacterium]